MIDATDMMYGTKLLREIESLYERTEQKTMISGDTIHIDINRGYWTARLHSIPDALEFISNAYQQIESILYNEDKDASKTGD